MMKKYIGIKSIQAEPQDKESQPGYKVIYEDGYISWSPKEVFDKAYISDQTMSFGFALEAMKMGFKVKRPEMDAGCFIIFDNKNVCLQLVCGTNICNVYKLNLEDIFACDWLVYRPEEKKETTE
jgi:hypothetical protein